jgi:hypothetical protein
MLLCVVRWCNFSLMSSSISSLFLVVGVRGLVPLGGTFGFFWCLYIRGPSVVVVLPGCLLDNAGFLCRVVSRPWC